MNDLPLIGAPTKEEKRFIDYIGHCIADYIEAHENTNRQTLMAGLFAMLYVVFDKQTSHVLDEKLAEVDEFCYFMKEKIKGTKLV